jgi:hypothetical protein
MKYSFLCLLCCASLCAQSDGLPWLQWGGPHRNFQTEAKLPDAWPAAGPKILWRRPLGEGYSSILKSNAWTPPTLVGSRLYIRDRWGAGKQLLPCGRGSVSQTFC